MANSNIENNRKLRTEAQKLADKKYYEKQKQTRATVEITKDLRDKLKSIALAENCTMIELIYKLIENNVK